MGRRRGNAARFLRTEVLGITQREMADIIGYLTPKSVTQMEQSEEERLTIGHLQLLRAYAVQHAIPWPDELLNDLVGHKSAAVKRARARK